MTIFVVIYSIGPTSKASKKRVTLFTTLTNVFFILGIKNAFLTLFIFFLTFITSIKKDKKTTAACYN